MYKMLATEIVAWGKMADYKVYRAKVNSRLEELGLPTFKAYGVLGRTQGMVFFASAGFETWEEVGIYEAKVVADEEIQKLTHELLEKGAIVGGSLEFFILTDL